MRIQYRQELAGNQYREIEFEGTLDELSEVSRTVSEANSLWQTMFGDDQSFWDILKGMFKL